MPALQSSRSDIRSLTGLRGIAAVWVITYHYLFRIPASLAHPDAFISHGYMAVDLFFVLSGFVMALSYAHYFASGFDLRKYGVFLIRRVARIYPAYFVMTTFIAVLLMCHVGDQEQFGLPSYVYAANFLLVQTWGIGISLDGAAWSVSAEVAAYLLFPLLTGMVLFSSKTLATLACMVCAAALLWIEITPKGFHPEFKGPLDIKQFQGWLAVIRCIGEFTAGLAAYRLAQRPEFVRLAGSQIFAAAIMVLMAVILMTPGLDYAVTIAAPLLVIILTGRNFLSGLLARRVPYFLGEISYAVYLVHGSFLRIKRIGHARLDDRLGAHDTAILCGLAFYALVLAAAWALYTLVEKPGRGYIRTLERFVQPGAEQAVFESEVAGTNSITGSGGRDRD